MIVSPPIAIVYMGSYYTMNMIHDIWVFTIFIMDVFIEYKNKSKTKMDASALASWSSNFMNLKSYFIFFFVTLWLCEGSYLMKPTNSFGDGVWIGFLYLMPLGKLRLCITCIFVTEPNVVALHAAFRETSWIISFLNALILLLLNSSKRKSSKERL